MGWWRSLFPLPTHGEDVERKLRRARPTPIPKIADGPITVAGTVEAIEPLVTAPLTGRSCVYWAVTVTEVMKSLVTFELANLDGGTPFWIVDGDARARVIPDGARVSAPFDTRLRAVAPMSETGSSWGGAEPPLLSSSERALVMPLRVSILRSSRLRLTEYTIEPGMAVLVRGASQTEADPHGSERGYREAATRIVLASAARAPLFVRVIPGRSSVQGAPVG